MKRRAFLKIAPVIPLAIPAVVGIGGEILSSVQGFAPVTYNVIDPVVVSGFSTTEAVLMREWKEELEMLYWYGDGLDE